MKLHRAPLAFLCLLALLLDVKARGSALDALDRQPDLTPEKLIRFFSSFAFELSADLQDPETFLHRKRGDCDDFASLASRLLTRHGYKTKLVVIMMEQQTHVVCYVNEAHGFLDFNHRRDEKPVVVSSAELEDIADKVACDFRSHWLMTSEFRYDNAAPVYLDVVFPPARILAKSGPDAVHQISTSAATNIVLSAASDSAAIVTPEKIARADTSPKSSSASLSSSGSTQ